MASSTLAETCNEPPCHPSPCPLCSLFPSRSPLLLPHYRDTITPITPFARPLAMPAPPPPAWPALRPRTRRPPAQRPPARPPVLPRRGCEFRFSGRCLTQSRRNSSKLDLVLLCVTTAQALTAFQLNSLAATTPPTTLIPIFLSRLFKVSCLLRATKARELWPESLPLSFIRTTSSGVTAWSTTENNDELP